MTSVLARLGVSLAEHQLASPVFSMVELPTLEDEIVEWEDGFDDPAYATFVAEGGGGYRRGIGCSIEVSSEHRGIVRPTNARFLGFAAVLPEARGPGPVARSARPGWSGTRHRISTVVTDWRETNLLSSRAWPRLGFRRSPAAPPRDRLSPEAERAQGSRGSAPAARPPIRTLASLLPPPERLPSPS